MPNAFDELMASIDPAARDAINTWCKHNSVAFVIKEADMTDPDAITHLQTRLFDVHSDKRQLQDEIISLQNAVIELRSRNRQARARIARFWDDNKEHPSGIKAEQALVAVDGILMSGPQ